MCLSRNYTFMNKSIKPTENSTFSLRLHRSNLKIITYMKEIYMPINFKINVINVIIAIKLLS